MTTAKEKHSMQTLIVPLNELAEKEYNRASSIHGDKFLTLHDGYGVIAEEVQESGDEVERIEAVMYQLLSAIRESRGKGIVDYAAYIRDRAIDGAAELVQVAAMCIKMEKTVMGE